MPKIFTPTLAYRATQSANAFFDRMEADGYETQHWRWVLREPSKLAPGAMLKMRKHFDCEIGDLLSAGFGRQNTYDDIEAIVCRNSRGEKLGVVTHIA